MINILETEQLIDKLKSKGVTFNLYSEEDAIKFLNQMYDFCKEIIDKIQK